MKFHSRILNEQASINEDGSVAFDSGVTYTPDEINLLKDATHGDVITVHSVKLIFANDLQIVSG